MNDTSVLWATGLMSVVAIIAAPIIALGVQRRLDESNAARKRREEIFKTLWVNRRRQLWIARVDALNMIDVEFYGEKSVQDGWEALRADLFRQEHPGLNEEQIFARREELYAALLYEISRVLDYDFSRTHIQDEVYRPVLHGQFDEIEIETKTRVLDLLRSDALPVRFVQPNQQVPGTGTQQTRG